MLKNLQVTEFRLKTYEEEGEMFVGVMIYKAPDLPLLSKALQVRGVAHASIRLTVLIHNTSELATEEDR